MPAVKEKKDRPEIELIERRLSLSCPERFLSKIIPELVRVYHSDREFVQTIYLNSDHARAHKEVPEGISIKARRYSKTEMPSPSIDQERYKATILKVGADEGERITFLSTLEELIETARKAGVNVRPYTAVQYYRQHYKGRADESLKVRIDSGIRYFFFPKNSDSSILSGEEHWTEVAIDYPPELSSLIENALIDNTLILAEPKETASYRLAARVAQRTIQQE